MSDHQFNRMLLIIALLVSALMVAASWYAGAAAAGDCMAKGGVFVPEQGICIPKNKISKTI